MKFGLKNIIILVLMIILNFQLKAQLQKLDEGYLYHKNLKNIQNLPHTSSKPIFICDLENFTDSTTPKDLLNLDLHFSQDKNQSQNPYYFLARPIFSLYGSYNSLETNSLMGYGAGLSFMAGLGDKLGFNYDLAYLKHSLMLHKHEFADLHNVFPGLGLQLNQGFPNNIYQNLNLAYRPYKEITLEAGFGKSFYGDGYRSLMLSYNAFNHPYLKAKLEVWNIKYEFMIAQLKDINVVDARFWRDFDNKYLYAHYLNWEISSWLSIGAFEAVISGPSHGFELAYLNPVIFYRPIEFSLGSTDNALMGANIKLNINKKYKFYAQLVLDDFNVKEFKGDIKHWLNPDDNSIRWGFFGNKYAWQAGIKLFDIAKIKNSNAFTELNFVRPYVYSHNVSEDNYGHFNQSLAHPLGANFVESISGINYLYKRFVFETKFMYAKTGLDTIGLHFGQNIYQPTMDALHNGNIPIKTYFNKTGQGIDTKIIFAELSAYYYINPKSYLAVKASFAYRKFSNEIEEQNNWFAQIGISGILFKNDKVF